MLLSRRIVAAAIAGTLLATCSDGPREADVGLDAADDVGDVGRGDSGHDASGPTPDVGVDATLDAARDGGPDDPGWVPLGGLPVDCSLERAEHPERLVSFAWESCGAGCQRMTASRGVSFLHGYVDGARRFAMVAMGNDSTDPRQVDALVEIDGAVVGGWHALDAGTGTDSCGIVPMAVGGGRAGLAAYAIAAGSTSASALFWTAPIEAIALQDTPTYTISIPVGEVPDSLYLSATNWAYQLSNGQLVLLDYANHWALMNSPAFRGLPYFIALPGDSVLYVLHQSADRLMVGTMADGPAPLRDLLPVEVTDFHTDGATMIWLQGTGWDASTMSYAHLELWSAPLATTAATVDAHYVRDFPGLYAGAFGGSWYAIASATRDMEVYDLRDGTVRRWASPDGGNVIDAPLYVTDAEILVKTTLGVYRIDPMTLPLVP